MMGLNRPDSRITPGYPLVFNCVRRPAPPRLPGDPPCMFAACTRSFPGPAVWGSGADGAFAETKTLLRQRERRAGLACGAFPGTSETVQQVFDSKRFQQETAVPIDEKADAPAELAVRAARHDKREGSGSGVAAKCLDEPKALGVAVHVDIDEGGAAAREGDDADSFVDVGCRDGLDLDPFRAQHAFDHPDKLDVVVEYRDTFRHPVVDHGCPFPTPPPRAQKQLKQRSHRSIAPRSQSKSKDSGGYCSGMQNARGLARAVKFSR